MYTYEGLGQFKKENYRVFTAEEHADAYREEYPTRRRQLNAIDKDLENYRDQIKAVEEQLKTEIFARHLGNKYGYLDLIDMKADFDALLTAYAEIKTAPCPAKVAKEQAKAAAEAAAKANPTAITIQLPENVTATDVMNIFKSAKRYAHAERMQLNFYDEENNAAVDAWTHIYNAARDIERDQLHNIAWATADAVKEYKEKTTIIKL